MSDTVENQPSSSAIWLLAWGFCLWFISVYIRLSYFPFVQVTSDTLSPFVGVIRWWNTGWFGAANPESDQWLWILSAPLIAVSSSISSLFWWKCVATTILVPCALWMVVQEIKRHQWFWMLVVTSILTLDMGLVDTMLSSFRGYWAPECMAVASMGLILWHRGNPIGGHIATVATIIAMGQHPLVLGMLSVLGWIWYQQCKRGEAWYISVGLAILVLIPRASWVFELMQCDAGGLACLTNIAVSSSESSQTSIQLIGRVLKDRLWVEMGFASMVMIVGLWKSSHRTLMIWSIGSVIGITILGLSISTLRPYHFRVLIVPMFILSVQGLARLGRVGVVLGSVWIGLVWFHRIEPVSWFNSLEETDRFAAFLCHQSDPVWLEGYGNALTVSPQSVGVAMFMKQCTASMTNRPDDNIWVLVSRKDPLTIGEISWTGEEHLLRRLSSKEWGTISNEDKWSGHDAALLFWSENDIQLH